MWNKEKEKIWYLKKGSTFNSKASEVKDELFLKNDFFDPQDLVQVKYEMLRKVEKEDFKVKEAVHLFGMSRQYYYKIKPAFDRQGMTGLLPDKRGPKHPFKLTEQTMKIPEKDWQKVYLPIPKRKYKQVKVHAYMCSYSCRTEASVAKPFIANQF